MSKGVMKENGNEKYVWIIPPVIFLAAVIGLGSEIGYFLGHSFSYLLFTVFTLAGVVGAVLYHLKKGQFKQTSESLWLIVVAIFLFFIVFFGPPATRKVDKQAGIEYKK